jgi:hypothetical protein
MFNYNFETRFEDVRDGLSNTIYLIQVPPTYPRPWIAGGGATVMGVPEKNSIAPFVWDQGSGKRGTHVIMGDGSVRFLSATMSDAAFQALVTKAGEDSAEDKGELVPPPAGSVGPAKVAPKPATGAAAAAPPISGWKESISKEGGYTVLLPTGGTTINSKQTVQAPNGSKVELNLNGVQFGDTAGFLVVYADIPAGSPQLSIEQRFEGAKQTMLLGMVGGKVAKEDKISLGGKYEGREYTVDFAGKGTVLVRVYITDTRIFQIVGGGEGYATKQADVRKFFDSFKLTGN